MTPLEETLHATNGCGRSCPLSDEHLKALRKAIQLREKVTALLASMEDGAVDNYLLTEVKELL